MAKRQVINGGFQDALGRPLNLGYLTFRVSVDAVTNDGNQVCAGRIVTVPLDAFGNVSGSVFFWPNDQLSPNTVYIVKAYSAAGQLVWQSEISIPSGGGAYNLGGSGSTIQLLSSAKSGAPQAATTSAIDTTGASLLVMAVNTYNNIPYVLANPSDSKGNTWVHATGAGNGIAGSGSNIALFYVVNPIVGTGHTFTFDAVSGGYYPGFCVAAFSVVKGSAPLDQQNIALANQPGSITPTADNELVLSYMGKGVTGASACSGFTVIQDMDYASGNNMGCVLAYLVQGTAAPSNPTWSNPTADATGIASFFHA